MQEHILLVISEYYNRNPAAVKCARRSEVKDVIAKQVAQYFLYRFTRLRDIEIAKLTGYNSKQMAKHGRKRIAKIAEADKGLKQQIQELENLIIRK